MVKGILAEAIGKLNKMTVAELKKEKADLQMIIDLRDEIILLKGNYESYLRRKLE